MCIQRMRVALKVGFLHLVIWFSEMHLIATLWLFVRFNEHFLIVQFWTFAASILWQFLINFCHDLAQKSSIKVCESWQFRNPIDIHLAFYRFLNRAMHGTKNNSLFIVTNCWMTHSPIWYLWSKINTLATGLYDYRSLTLEFRIQ